MHWTLTHCTRSNWKKSFATTRLLSLSVITADHLPLLHQPSAQHPWTFSVVYLPGTSIFLCPVYLLYLWTSIQWSSSHSLTCILSLLLLNFIPFLSRPYFHLLPTLTTDQMASSMIVHASAWQYDKCSSDWWAFRWLDYQTANCVLLLIFPVLNQPHFYFRTQNLWNPSHGENVNNFLFKKVFWKQMLINSYPYLTRIYL